MKAITLPRRTPLDPSTPCWPWAGTKTDQGYGRVMVDSTNRYVHRLAYQLHVGPIPRGWEVDHVCHTAAVTAGECQGGACEHRACWNPAHLEAVSSAENSRRGNHPLFAVARSQQCRRGHDLTNPENVYERPDGRRRCRVCEIDGQRERRARSKR